MIWSLEHGEGRMGVESLGGVEGMGGGPAPLFLSVFSLEQ